MLILSRMPGQRVRITTPDGNELWILIQSTDPRGKVRLGFEGGREFVIAREEVIVPDGDDVPPSGAGILTTQSITR